MIWTSQLKIIPNSKSLILFEYGLKKKRSGMMRFVDNASGTRTTAENETIRSNNNGGRCSEN